MKQCLCRIQVPSFVITYQSLTQNEQYVPFGILIMDVQHGIPFNPKVLEHKTPSSEDRQHIKTKPVSGYIEDD
jgi:hypothetical protein